MGSRGGEVVGEATGRDRGRRMVCRVRGEVVKLVNYVNWTLGHQRREVELGVVPFIGAQGGNDRNQLAPTRCTTVAMMAHIARDETARGRLP